MQLTNEQIARVFAMYSGQKWTNGLDNEHRVMTYSVAETLPYAKVGENKLLLSPLSAITDEDVVVVTKIHHPEVMQISRTKRLANGFEVYNINGFIGYISWSRLENLSAQYLISKGYAVPLFIAPNHPDNGKDAISLGLAIDKTTHKS